MNRAHKLETETEAGELSLSMREPLAVLLLSTDILRSHSGQLTAGMLAEQRAAMRRAATQLEGALQAPAKEAKAGS